MRHSLSRTASIHLARAAGAVLLPALLLAGTPAQADEVFRATSALSLPNGQKITSFDISYVDPVIGLYALADRTNKSVDVFDTYTNTLQVELKGRFAGFTGDNDTSGPNGIVFVKNREIWAGDGNSRVKVIDLFSRRVTHTIPTGGKFRADELCYDPRENVVLIANDAEHDNPSKWPFVTFISANNYNVLSRITFDGTRGVPKATNGIEQCQWDMRTGKFYLNIPEVNGPGDDSAPGAVVVINPKSMSIEAVFTIPLRACAGPQGMAIGPQTQILLGCHLTASAVINEDGRVLRSFRNEFGSDEVWFNPGDNHYFLGENGNVTPRLGVIDAVVPNVGPQADRSPATGESAHSVAADPVFNQVYVPIPSTATLGVCSSAGGDDSVGCIAVFTSTPEGPDHMARR